jgi:3D (Asp-Asp-Asp) domain-containing protein
VELVAEMRRIVDMDRMTSTRSSIKVGQLVGAVVSLLLMGAITASSPDKHALTVKVTAFNSTPAQTDARPNETACGDRIAPGDRIVAVSRDLKAVGLECGQQIRIEGLDGSWTVADSMAARHEQRVDIYMGNDVKAARQWGVKEREIRWEE